MQETSEISLSDFLCETNSPKWKESFDKAGKGRLFSGVSRTVVTLWAVIYNLFCYLLRYTRNDKATLVVSQFLYLF